MAKLRLKHFESGDAVEDADFARRLKSLQLKLQQIQTVYLNHDERAVILFEGWDAGGKGGTIRRIAEPLDPRFVKVHPISAPNGIEKEQHYLQRFWSRLPGGGEVAIFDRSWYGRVLVERVEGFCSKMAWKRAYDEINDFEKALTDDGIRVIKFFLHITQEEQDARLLSRLVEPQKRWKTGLEDYRNRSRRADYMDALHDMFDRTSTSAAPWHVVAANDKNAARLEVIETTIRRLRKGMRLTEPAIAPDLLAAAEAALGKVRVAAALKEA